jgi:energy-coupling factor transporter transmembrane protein EcfT
MSLGVGAVGILLEGARTKTPAARWFARWDSAVRFLVLAGFVAAFVAAITPLGMLVAVGVFLLGFLAIYLSGRWLTVLFIAAGTPLGLYLIFERWLKLLLPRSLLGF